MGGDGWGGEASDGIRKFPSLVLFFFLLFFSFFFFLFSAPICYGDLLQLGGMKEEERGEGEEGRGKTWREKREGEDGGGGKRRKEGAGSDRSGRKLVPLD